MIETILVAVGPAEDERVGQLADQAIDIAEPNDTKVVILHVFEDNSYDNSVMSYNELVEKLGDGHPPKPTPTQLARRQTHVRTIKEALDEAGVETEVRGETGERADQIRAVAADIDADNIIIGGRKRSPTGKAMFGSVAQNIMLNADCPVTFVRSESGNVKKTLKNAVSR